jgi:Response regulator receiver domain
VIAPGAPPTALLVDDENRVRNLARLVLLPEGLDVPDAPAAEGALLVAAAHPSDIRLLVTDLRMPGMSGRELGGRLRARRPGLRVLYASGDPWAEVPGPSSPSRWGRGSWPARCWGNDPGRHAGRSPPPRPCAGPD